MCVSPTHLGSAIVGELFLGKDQFKVTHIILSDVLHLTRVQLRIITLKILCVCVCVVCVCVCMFQYRLYDYPTKQSQLSENSQNLRETF